MKAQSDLTGDRERLAEMTRPRNSGVTKWNSLIYMASKTDDKMMLQCIDCDKKPAPSNTTDSSATTYEPIYRKANDVHDTIDTLHDEVNHRPAAQQWAVCTP